jgi:hypothetical protein
MVDPRRVLARLVSRTSSWELSSRDTSPERMMTADVLMALGCVHDRLGQGLVLAKWCGDFSMVEECHAVLLDQYRELADIRGWRSHNERTSENICWLAIEELVSPNLCRECRGAGEKWHTKRQVRMVCAACGGGGVKAPSNRARARYCEIGEASWRDRWGVRYAAAFSLADQAHAAALGRVRRALQ